MGKICAIILAAGKGTRMGAKLNKIYLKIDNKPILYYSLKVFSQNQSIDNIIVVAGKDEIDYCRTNVVNKYGFKKVTDIVEGGTRRQDSVYNGLKAIKNCDIVVIHDGARPFVDNEMIDNGIKYSKIYGACACGVPPKDTIKILDSNNFSKETLNRNSLFCVQTPQCFKYSSILECHDKLRKQNVNVTDDTMVYEKYKGKVYLYKGNYNNIKVTTSEDLILGNAILKNKQNIYE